MCHAVGVAVIGTGWCGNIRAETLSRSALVDKLHICQVRKERLAEVRALVDPATAIGDHRDILRNAAIEVAHIWTTPESKHFPIARDCLKADEHVLLQKPIAMERREADELIQTAWRNGLTFTIGYSPALPHQDRPRQETDPGLHTRVRRQRDGQPPSVAQPRREDRPGLKLSPAPWN